VSQPDPSHKESAGASGETEAILAEVHVYSKTELIAKYAIEHGEYIIGRDASSHIVVEAEEVSRHHARVSFSAYELIIEDLGSSNGVFIGGVQVLIPTRVRADQEVQIGAARLFFRLSAAASAQLSAALADKDLGLVPLREMLAGKKYKVITTIGRGGMGVVMQARDLRIRRTVAMKVMKTMHQFSRENVLRFVDEAQLTGQLEHPNIVPVYELGNDEAGESFYTMKYVKGITLDDVLRGLRHGRPQMIGKYPLGALLTIFQKICDAVAFAHSKGVIHRDLKPENVMIGAYGEVLVMDWGLAKNLTGAQRGGGQIETTFATEPHPDPRGFQTLHGLIVGTPPYISPEQARGELDRIDTRSDIYVLGQILYGILTLRPPVSGKTVPEIVEAIVNSRIMPPTTFNGSPKSDLREPAIGDGELFELLHLPGKRVPDGLSAVVMKAMQLAPDDRYQSVEEMQSELQAFQGGFATKAERAGPGKQMLLWAGRHKGEVALFIAGFILINAVAATLIYQLNAEKNRAQGSEQKVIANLQRAEESERVAAQRLEQLRGTAPTFFEEAQSLLEEQSFAEALDKIDYAIAQVPNDPKYHTLHGQILQSLLRWDEAILAFEEALRRDPRLEAARINLELTKRLNTEAQRAGEVTPAIRLQYVEALFAQGRGEEALALLPRNSGNLERFRRAWGLIFEKRGLKQRFEVNDDGNLNVDLRGVRLPDFRNLRGLAVASIMLDDSFLPDLTPLKGFKLQRLSINRTPVFDLRPLAGMPLRSLSMDGTRVTDLSPLSQLPLESLSFAETRVNDLTALTGKEIEELVAADCKGLEDLSPLKDLPLQRLDLSRTGVRDLTPITGTPIRELNLEGCTSLTDLKPLLEMRQLETAILPAQCTEIEYLRGHPSLRRLSYKKLTQSVAEFWKEFDTRKVVK
jgi:serine/threonine protein kinase